jgi:hypothetical protein
MDSFNPYDLNEMDVAPVEDAKAKRCEMFAVHYPYPLYPNNYPYSKVTVRDVTLRIPPKRSLCWNMS